MYQIINSFSLLYAKFSLYRKNVNLTSYLQYSKILRPYHRVSAIVPAILQSMGSGVTVVCGEVGDGVCSLVTVYWTG